MQLVQALVPDADRRFGPALAAAVRAAGADPELAARVTAVRDRLLARRYGPAAPAAEDARLAAEVARDRAPARRVAARRGGDRGVPLLSLLALRRRRSTRRHRPRRRNSSTKAARCTRRRTRSPGGRRRSLPWRRTGTISAPPTTGWGAGAGPRPRGSRPGGSSLAKPSVRRALELTPPADLASARWTWSPPVTPEELLLWGRCGWIVGWLGWMLRPAGARAVAGPARLRRRGRARRARPPCLVPAADGDRARRRHAPALAPRPGARARAGRGGERGRIVLRRVPGWVLVRAAGGREGWLPADAVAAVGG